MTSRLWPTLLFAALVSLAACAGPPPDVGSLRVSFAPPVLRVEASAASPSTSADATQLCPWRGPCWIYADGDGLVGSEQEPDETLAYEAGSTSRAFVSYLPDGGDSFPFVQAGGRFDFVATPTLLDFASGGMTWVSSARIPRRAARLRLLYRLQSFRGGNATFFLGNGAKYRVVNVDGATAEEDDLEMPLVENRFGWATNGQDVGLTIWLAGFSF